MPATWNNVPHYYANDLPDWASFLRLGYSQTLRVAMWGDSQETSPGGSGSVYIPSINRELGLIFKNYPETGFSLASSYGNKWLLSGSISGTTAGAYASTKLPPNLITQRVTSGINGILTALMPYGEGGSESNYQLYWPRNNTVCDIFAIASPGSGEITWTNKRQTISPGFFTTNLGSGTLTLGLNQAEEIKMGTIPIVWDADAVNWPTVSVNLTGTSASPTEILGLRFRRTDKTNGMVVYDFAAGGYTKAIMMTNHPNCDAVVRALDFDCHWVKLGVNDIVGNQSISAFKAEMITFIAWIRAKANDPTARVILESEVYVIDSNVARRIPFDEMSGALHEIAQSDSNVLFINGRRLTEEAGLGALTESFDGLTNRGAWSSASVSYAVNDYVQVGTKNYRVPFSHVSSSLTGTTTSKFLVPHQRFLADGVHYTDEGARLLANREADCFREIMEYAPLKINPVGVSLVLPYRPGEIGVTCEVYNASNVLVLSSIPLTETTEPGKYSGSVTLGSGYYTVLIYSNGETVRGADFAIDVVGTGVPDYADTIDELQSRKSVKNTLGTITGLVT